MAPADDLDGLDAVLPCLRCPVCTGALTRDQRQLRCSSGHSFDLARQGYVNLAVGTRAGTADTAAMVAARDAFLGRGHFRPIAEAVADLVAAALTDGVTAGPTVVDLAGGTGYHLASVLDRTSGRGVCLDISAPALRRAARAHPRAAAVGADTWQRLPLGDGVADALLSIFGPRNPAEIERVLSPGGRFVTVAPEPGHLRELIDPLSMVGVDPDKAGRAATAFARFELLERRTLRYPVVLTSDDAYAAAAMGPSAWHVPSTELRARADALPAELDVTVDVTLAVYRRADVGSALRAGTPPP